MTEQNHNTLNLTKGSLNLPISKIDVMHPGFMVIQNLCHFYPTHRTWPVFHPSHAGSAETLGELANDKG